MQDQPNEESFEEFVDRTFPYPADTDDELELRRRAIARDFVEAITERRERPRSSFDAVWSTLADMYAREQRDDALECYEGEPDRDELADEEAAIIREAHIRIAAIRKIVVERHPDLWNG